MTLFWELLTNFGVTVDILQQRKRQKDEKSQREILLSDTKNLIEEKQNKEKIMMELMTMRRRISFYDQRRWIID